MISPDVSSGLPSENTATSETMAARPAGTENMMANTRPNFSPVIEVLSVGAAGACTIYICAGGGVGASGFTMFTEAFVWYLEPQWVQVTVTVGLLPASSQAISSITGAINSALPQFGHFAC